MRTPSRRAQPVLAVAVGLIAAGGLARADEGTPPSRPAPRVLLWPEPGAAPHAGAETGLADALRRRVPDVIPSARLRDGPEVAAVLRREAEDLSHAEEALAAARHAFLAFEYVRARDRLVALTSEYLVALTGRGQWRLLGEGFRLLGQVELAAGRPPEALAAARTAVLLLAAEPSRGTVPPSYARLELDARNEAARSARRALRIRSTPPGAELALDGRPAGVTPATADEAPGPHVVRLELPGHGPVARVVHVGPDGADVHVNLAPDPGNRVLLAAMPRGLLDPEPAAVRQLLLEMAGATHIVSYAVRSTTVTARVHPSQGGPVPVGTGDPPLDDLARRIADAVLGATPRPASPVGAREGSERGASAPAPDPRRGEGLPRRWWLWTTIGAAVAGGAAAAAWAAGRPDSMARICVGGCPGGH